MKALAFVPDLPAQQVHDSLRQSLVALEQAQQCAVLWFAEIRRRHLYRDFGFASINQYALQELGFSKTRTGDFIRLARQLEDLPAVREAMSSGDLGYTKAREIVGVVTPETQADWLEAARAPRRELIREVKRARQAAKVDPGQGELLPQTPTVVAPKELPVRFQVDLTPEQEARRAALVERLHKLGDVPVDRGEFLLEALAAWVESKEKAPRGALTSAPPVQIHVHDHGERLTVSTAAGERELSRTDAERMQCDALICRPGKRATRSIPAKIRRAVLTRDRHRCRAPGCHRTRFLEVHHRVARSQGGSNHPDNLVTLCGSCHRLWHERGRRISA
jgi:hypothetical protein